MPQPTNQNLSILSVLSLCIPYFMGFASAILAEPVRKKIFKPKLKLEFENNQDYRTLTPETSSYGIDFEAFYIRIKVTNKSWYTAFGCRAHLVNIEIKNAKGQFERTAFVDSLRLAWSCQPTGDAYRPLDLPKNVNQFIDVLSVRPQIRTRQNNLTFEEELRPGNFTSSFKLEVQTFPLRYRHLIEGKGEYRYTIFLTADGVDPKSIRVIFKWNNDWQNFEVSKD